MDGVMAQLKRGALHTQATDLVHINSDRYRATHQATVDAVLQEERRPVSSRGETFYNRDRWTLRYFVQILFDWLHKSSQKGLNRRDLERLVGHTNQYSVSSPEIVIAQTPHTLHFSTALALTGGAYHEAWHTLYTPRHNLNVDDLERLLRQRVGVLQSWIPAKRMVLEWYNIIEDIRIERLGRERFPGAISKMHYLQDLILKMEAQAPLDTRDELFYLTVAFRDRGLGYETVTQAERWAHYREACPQAVHFVTEGPLRPLLHEAMQLKERDGLAALRIALDIVTLLRRTGADTKPQSALPQVTGMLAQAPHASLKTLQEQIHFADQQRLLTQKKIRQTEGKIRANSQSQWDGRARHLRVQQAIQTKLMNKLKALQREAHFLEAARNRLIGARSELQVSRSRRAQGLSAPGGREEAEKQSAQGQGQSNPGGREEAEKQSAQGQGQSSPGGREEAEKQSGSGGREEAEKQSGQAGQNRQSRRSRRNRHPQDVQFAQAVVRLIHAGRAANTHSASSALSERLSQERKNEAQSQAWLLLQQSGVGDTDAHHEEEGVALSTAQRGRNHRLSGQWSLRKIAAPPQERASLQKRSDHELQIVRRQCSALRARILRKMHALQDAGVQHGLRRGSALSEPYLVDTALKLREGGVPTRAFKQVTPKIEQVMAVAIVIDESSSMAEGTRIGTEWVSKSAMAARLALTLSEPLSRLNVPTCAFGFCYEQSPHTHGEPVHFDTRKLQSEARFYENELSFHLYQGFHERLEHTRHRFGLLQASGGTPMAEGISFATMLLRRRPERHRFVFVITDGEPTSSAKLMAWAFQGAKQAGLHVIGVGLGEGAKGVQRTFEDHVWAQDLERLPQLLIQKLEDLVSRRIVTPR